MNRKPSAIVVSSQDSEVGLLYSKPQDERSLYQLVGRSDVGGEVDERPPLELQVETTEEYEFRAPFTWEMKSSKDFELEVPGDGYASASASKFVGDDEAAYFLYTFSSILGSDPRVLLVLGELTSMDLGGGGRYTSTLRAAEVVLASAFTVGGRRSRPEINDLVYAGFLRIAILRRCQYKQQK